MKAEPVKLSMLRLRRGKAQAVIANSGNANACTGDNGANVAVRMAHAAAVAVSKLDKWGKIDEDDVCKVDDNMIAEEIDNKIIKSINFHTLSPLYFFIIWINNHCRLQ